MISLSKSTTFCEYIFLIFRLVSCCNVLVTHLIQHLLSLLIIKALKIMELKAFKNILPNLMLIFEVVEDFPILPHLTLA